MTMKWSTEDGVVSIFAEEGFGGWLACDVCVRGVDEDDQLIGFFLISSEEIGETTEFVLRDAHLRAEAAARHEVEGPLPAHLQQRLDTPAPAVLRSVPCPSCGAAPGERCITSGGNRLQSVHAARRKAAAP